MEKIKHSHDDLLDENEVHFQQNILEEEYLLHKYKLTKAFIIPALVNFAFVSILMIFTIMFIDLFNILITFSENILPFPKIINDFVNDVLNQIVIPDRFIAGVIMIIVMLFFAMYFNASLISYKASRLKVIIAIFFNLFCLTNPLTMTGGLFGIVGSLNYWNTFSKKHKISFIFKKKILFYLKNIFAFMALAHIGLIIFTMFYIAEQNNLTNFFTSSLTVIGMLFVFGGFMMFSYGDKSSQSYANVKSIVKGMWILTILGAFNSITKIYYIQEKPLLKNRDEILVNIRAIKTKRWS